MVLYKTNFIITKKWWSKWSEKSFEYFKIASEIDSIEDVEQIKNIAKCFCKQFIKLDSIKSDGQYHFCIAYPFKLFGIFLGFPDVLAIYLIGAFTQVREPVVWLVTIPMVHLLFRPFACHQQPRKPVAQKEFSKNTDLPIPPRVILPSNSVRFNAPTWNTPPKNPRIWIVG